MKRSENFFLFRRKTSKPCNFFTGCFVIKRESDFRPPQAKRDYIKTRWKVQGKEWPHLFGRGKRAATPAAAPAESPHADRDSGVLLEVRHVERIFEVGNRKLHVLKGINLELRPRELVMLRGRSGSGKTTLLNLMGGLDVPTRGEILFRGQPLHAWNDDARTAVRRKDIGFIFQAYALIPLLSAYENVELSLRMAGVPRSEWRSRVRHCLELVGLGKRMDHRPYEMSGGEQQRVAIAKAIAHRPSLILADEPTAELDSQMGARIMAVFREIIATEGVSICMTTHDPTILEVADHVYEMVDGKIVNRS